MLTSELCYPRVATKTCCRMWLNVKMIWQRYKCLVLTDVAVVEERQREPLPLCNCDVATLISLWSKSVCSQGRILCWFVTFVVFVFPTSFKILAFRNKLVNIYKTNHTKQRRRLEKCFSTKTMCFTEPDCIIQFYIWGYICKNKRWNVTWLYKVIFQTIQVKSK